MKLFKKGSGEEKEEKQTSENQKKDEKEKEAKSEVKKETSSTSESEKEDGSSSFQAGEYMIHLYMQDVRGLGVGDKTSDIIASITAFEETKYSKVYKDVGPSSAIYLAEHFFFNAELRSSSSANTTLKIAFFNHRMVGPDSIIGQTELTLGDVYRNKDHAVLHTWGFLQHPKSKFDQIAGFYKYSLNVVRAGEPRLNLGDEQKLDKDDANKFDLLYPPEIKLTKYQLKLKLARGTNFIIMDSSGLTSKGKCDPFMTVEYNGMKLESSIQNDTLEPCWNEEFLLPATKPTVADTIIVSFMDYDTVGKNDYIGAICYKVSDILADKYKNPFWECIYGAPKEAEDENQQKLENSEPSLGSYLKGEVLMQWSYEQIKGAPLKKTQKSADPIKESSIPCSSMELRVKVGYMFNCYSNKDSSHSILVKWGKFEMMTKKQKNENGVVIWNEAGTIKPLLYFYDLEELPDVFIYLLHTNGKVISYKRIPVKTLMDPEQPENYYFLLPERCNNRELRDDQGGMLNIRLAIQKEDKWPAIEKNTNWILSNLQKYSYSPITIISNIFQAKKLAAADEDGLSDPVVLAYHFGNSTKTEPYPRTLNPVWNKRLMLQTFAINGVVPPLILTLYDYDEGTLTSSTKFEFIGSMLYFFQQKDIIQSQSQIPNPEWHKINYSNDMVMGQILCSFTVLNGHEKIPKLLPITVVQKKHYIKINVLGLRDLESLGIFPVRRAFIKMNEINSLESAKDAVHMDIGTQPKDSGPNPNIGSVISFEMDLPDDPNLMPLVTFIVFDKQRIGKSVSIGAFDLDLGVQLLITKARILKKVMSYLMKSKNVLTQERAKKLIKIVDTLKAEISEEKKYMTITESEAEMLEESSPDKSESEIEGGSPTMSKFVNFGVKTMEEGVENIGLDKIIPPKRATTILEETKEEEEEKPHMKMLNLLKRDMVKEKKISIQNIVLKEKVEEPKKKQPEAEGENEQDEEDDALIKKKPESKPEKENVKSETSEAKKKYNSIPKKDRKKYSELYVLEPEIEIQRLEGREIKKEVNIPDLDDYMELGHGANKHYRFLVPKELENTRIIGTLNFLTVPIFRGKKVGDISFLDKILGKGKGNHFRKCGSFKGSLMIMSEETMELCKPIRSEPALLSNLGVPCSAEDFEITNVDAELLSKNEVVIHVYIVDANIFESYDIGSESDPYIKIYLGSKEVVNDKGNFIENRNNPQFMKMFTLETTIPGESKLSIQIWDSDPIGRDEFIGETIIDIENRFFDARFRELVNIPVETRDIKHPSSSLSKGTLRMWANICNKGDKSALNFKKLRKTWDISPSPEVEMQARAIVWEVYEVPMADIEGTCDIYVTGNLNGLSDMQMKTDTHYRSQNGFGGFNWRMLWNVKIDQYSNFNTMNLNLKIWDRDLLSANDYLAEATINLGSFIKDSVMNGGRNKLYGMDKDEKEHSEKIYIETIPNPNLKEKEKKKKAKILFSFELVPIEQAKANKVGHGRSEPNIDPFLSPPKGRIYFSLNPFTMFEQLVGPVARRTIYICCYCILCIACICVCFPMIFSDLVSELILSIF